jgi:hypothetical protein
MLGLLACQTPRQTVVELPADSPNPSGVRAPRLLVQAMDSSWHELAVSDLSLKVRIIGNQATTQVGMTLSNPSKEVLAGRFFFPLAEGQQLAGFALDIDGEMRPAVAVPRPKARATFESIVRKQVDPGLVEWRRDGYFETRIYPIPARGSRRIELTYEEALAWKPEGQHYLWDWVDALLVEQFQLEIEVIREGSPPGPISWQGNSITWSGQGNHFFASLHTKAMTVREPLMISFASSESTQVFVQETGPAETWFSAQVALPELRRKRPTIRTLGLLLDQSNSARLRDATRLWAALEAYLKTMPGVEVEVWSFALELKSEGSFEAEDGSWTALKERLQALPADGATSFGALKLAQVKADRFLLWTDGLHTFGPAEISPDPRPMDIWISGKRNNLGYLKQIAGQFGGHLLAAAELSPREVAEKSGWAPYQLISVSYDRADFREVLPGGPQLVGNQLWVGGKLLGDEGVLYLNLGFDQEIHEQVAVRVDKARHLNGAQGLPRWWAVQQLRAWETAADPPREAIQALSQQYGLLSRETSLLVLETVEDYVEHEILPPPGLRAAYDQQLRQKKAAESFELLSQLDQVAEGFQARINWWQTDFQIPLQPYQPDPLKKTLSEEEDDFGGAADEETGAGQLMDLFDLEEMVVEGDISADGVPEPKPESATKAGAIQLEIQAWNPETPYLQAMESAPRDQRYAAYLQQKETFGKSPAFYFDMSGWLWEQGDSAMSILVLSNLAELKLDQHELLRVLGRRLQLCGKLPAARRVFERVLDLRPEEPHSWRDLALIQAEMGKPQAAIDLLYEVVTRKWDDRFSEIGILAAHEMNAIMGRSRASLQLEHLDPRLIADLPTDLRVVIDWDQNDADMDLWVTDPRGEKCYYQHARTEIGGLISQDITGGYGPEEFLLKRAMPGRYVVEVNYYGGNGAEWIGPVTVQGQLIRNYGRPDERRKTLIFRLSGESEVLKLGEFVVEE